MHLRITRWLVVALAAACLVPAAAAAQDGPPPPPTAANGAPVTTLAQGLGTPTSFAFGAGAVFLGTAPSEAPDGPVGGLYVLKDGEATAVPGLPPIVFGLAWRKGTLYVSAGKNLYAASGWDGAKFAKVKAIYKGSKTVQRLQRPRLRPERAPLRGHLAEPEVRPQARRPRRSHSRSSR